MRVAAILALVLVTVLTGAHPLSAQGEAVQDTSSVISAPESTDGISPQSPFDTIDASDYAAPRSFSLDNFMETLTRYLIGRAGPIGAQASYSRYGFGSGRGLVYLGRLLLNDPQDDRVPLALVPTTAIEELVFGESPTRHLSGQCNIEGVIRIIEPQEMEAEPMTDLELSTGDHRLKQRRARFASPRKPAGLDIGYDGLSNNGYNFDATGQIQLQGQGFGSSSGRTTIADVRGVFPSGEKYRFALQQFQTSFQGDTLDPFSDNRRYGYIAMAEASADHVDVGLYGRSYNVSTRDSVTANETTALGVTVPVTTGTERRIFVGAGYETIFSKQAIAGASTSDRLQKVSASVSTVSRVGDKTVLEAAADVSLQYEYAWGWGARVAATRQLSPSNRLTILGRRGYRLPNLGELFLPLHRSGSSAPGDTTNVVGNTELKSEASLEATLQLYTSAGPIRNEFRATTIRVRDPILDVAAASAPNPLVRPENTEAQGLQIIEDRLRVVNRTWGFEIFVDGGVMIALGDRDRYFRGVPVVRTVVSASIGRSLFKDTSHILLGGDYVYSGSRVAGGAELDPYGVLNLKLEARLIDAHLYLLWMNVGDVGYETLWPYLMTPRTFVYGISWTLYN